MQLNGAHRSSTTGRGMELLSVRVGDQDFALDIMAVREIRGWVASTPLPHAPSYIRGMINLRGVVLAIVDLAARLGLPGAEPGAASVVVVVETGGVAMGLLVDAVSDIITVTEEEIQDTPKTGAAAGNAAVAGLIARESGIMSIISVPEIMPKSDELDQVAA